MRVFTVLLRKGLQSCVEMSNAENKRGFFRKVFGKHLFLANTLSSGFLMGLGDYCQQKIEMSQAKPNAKPFDSVRTVNMSIVGLSHGVFHHFFYGWMDRKFPGKQLRYVMYKILLDQAIASPACMWIFLLEWLLWRKKL